MRVVIALGGNALVRKGERPDTDIQAERLREAAAAVAEVAAEHEVVVTHGNGPQIGMLALQAAALAGGRETPLDIFGAESEGLIGYMIERALAAALPGRDIATLLTMVEVDAGDPAFAHPSKPIGPWYDAAEARGLEAERGWHFVADGERKRRVVPSPIPQRILELPTIRLLVENGVLVICAGRGGIPVALGADGAIRGIDAVIDKDRAAAVLAQGLGADALLLLTYVDAVYRDWGTKDAEPIATLSPGDAAALTLDPGSMGPKVEAAAAFVAGGGALAGIGRLEAAGDILAGRAGTTVRQR
ncbi:MAG: carbamate kinase [Alphaproteobacteria bacterium]